MSEKKEFLTEENYERGKKKLKIVAIIVLVIGLLIAGSLITVGILKQSKTNSNYSEDTIKKLQNDIKHKKIAFFVENTQSDSKVISSIVSLCQKYDVPVIKVTETTPKGKDYLQWMSSEYEQVLKIQEDRK